MNISKSYGLGFGKKLLSVALALAVTTSVSSFVVSSMVNAASVYDLDSFDAAVTDGDNLYDVPGSLNEAEVFHFGFSALPDNVRELSLVVSASVLDRGNALNLIEGLQVGDDSSLSGYEFSVLSEGEVVALPVISLRANSVLVDHDVTVTGGILSDSLAEGEDECSYFGWSAGGCGDFFESSSEVERFDVVFASGSEGDFSGIQSDYDGDDNTVDAELHISFESDGDVEIYATVLDGVEGGSGDDSLVFGSALEGVVVGNFSILTAVRPGEVRDDFVRRNAISLYGGNDSIVFLENFTGNYLSSGEVVLGEGDDVIDVRGGGDVRFVGNYQASDIEDSLYVYDTAIDFGGGNDLLRISLSVLSDSYVGAYFQSGAINFGLGDNMFVLSGEDLEVLDNILFDYAESVGYLGDYYRVAREAGGVVFHSLYNSVDGGYADNVFAYVNSIYDYDIKDLADYNDLVPFYEESDGAFDVDVAQELWVSSFKKGKIEIENNTLGNLIVASDHKLESNVGHYGVYAYASDIEIRNASVGNILLMGLGSAYNANRVAVVANDGENRKFYGFVDPRMIDKYVDLAIGDAKRDALVDHGSGPYLFQDDAYIGSIYRSVHFLGAFKSGGFVNNFLDGYDVTITNSGGSNGSYSGNVIVGDFSLSAFGVNSIIAEGGGDVIINDIRNGRSFVRVDPSDTLNVVSTPYSLDEDFAKEKEYHAIHTLVDIRQLVDSGLAEEVDYDFFSNMTKFYAIADEFVVDISSSGDVHIKSIEVDGVSDGGSSIDFSQGNIDLDTRYVSLNEAGDGFELGGEIATVEGIEYTITKIRITDSGLSESATDSGFLYLHGFARVDENNVKNREVFDNRSFAILGGGDDHIEIASDQGGVRFVIADNLQDDDINNITGSDGSVNIFMGDGNDVFITNNLSPVLVVDSDLSVFPVIALVDMGNNPQSFDNLVVNTDFSLNVKVVGIELNEKLGDDSNDEFLTYFDNVSGLTVGEGYTLSLDANPNSQGNSIQFQSGFDPVVFLSRNSRVEFNSVSGLSSSSVKGVEAEKGLLVLGAINSLVTAGGRIANAGTIVVQDKGLRLKSLNHELYASLLSGDFESYVRDNDIPDSTLDVVYVSAIDQVFIDKQTLELVTFSSGVEDASDYILTTSDVKEFLLKSQSSLGNIRNKDRYTTLSLVHSSLLDADDHDITGTTAHDGDYEVYSNIRGEGNGSGARLLVNSSIKNAAAGRSFADNEYFVFGDISNIALIDLGEGQTVDNVNKVHLLSSSINVKDIVIENYAKVNIGDVGVLRVDSDSEEDYLVRLVVTNDIIVERNSMLSLSTEASDVNDLRIGFDSQVEFRGGALQIDNILFDDSYANSQLQVESSVSFYSDLGAEYVDLSINQSNQSLLLIDGYDRVGEDSQEGRQRDTVVNFGANVEVALKLRNIDIVNIQRSDNYQVSNNDHDLSLYVQNAIRYGIDEKDSESLLTFFVSSAEDSRSLENSQVFISNTDDPVRELNIGSKVNPNELLGVAGGFYVQDVNLNGALLLAENANIVVENDFTVNTVLGAEGVVNSTGVIAYHVGVSSDGNYAIGSLKIEGNLLAESRQMNDLGGLDVVDGNTYAPKIVISDSYGDPLSVGKLFGGSITKEILSFSTASSSEGLTEAQVEGMLESAEVYATLFDVSLVGVKNDQGDYIGVNAVIDSPDFDTVFNGFSPDMNNSVAFDYLEKVANDDSLTGQVRVRLAQMAEYARLYAKAEGGDVYGSNALEIEGGDVNFTTVLSALERDSRGVVGIQDADAAKTVVSLADAKEILSILVEQLVPETNQGSRDVSFKYLSEVNSVISDRIGSRAKSTGIATGDAYERSRFGFDSGAEGEKISNAWSQVFYSVGEDEASTVNSFAGQDYTVYGANVGIDSTLYNDDDGKALFGFSVGAFDAEIEGLGVAAVNTDINGYSASLYGAYIVDNIVFEGSFSYVASDRNYKRVFDEVVFANDKDIKDRSYSFRLGVRYDVLPLIMKEGGSNAFLDLIPSLTYNRVKLGAFSEEASDQQYGGFERSVDEQVEQSYVAGLQVKLGTQFNNEQVFKDKGLVISPYVKAGISHTSSNDTALNVNLSYRLAQGIDVSSDNFSGFAYNVGVGGSVELGESFYLNAEYDYQIKKSDNYEGTSHNFGAKLGYRF